MTSEYYKYGIHERRRLMADAGFSRDEQRIWSHRDGRAIGEGVMLALTDDAFFRYLGIDRPNEDMLTSAEAADFLEIQIH